MYKICHMTSAHNAEDIRIFHKECVSLADAGYDVFLVERGSSYDKKGVHIIGVGEIPNSLRKRILFGARRVYIMARSLNCDVYHLHDPELLPYGLKLKRLGKKVIFDSHELTREQILIKPYLPFWLAKIISFLYSLLENYILKRIDGVIFPCPIGGEFPLPGKNTAYVNNVPKLEEFYDHFDPNVKKEERSICTIGSLTPERGIKQLIISSSRANCRLYLGGIISPDEFTQELEMMPECKDAVFLGYLNREQVVNTIEKCQVGVAAVLHVGQYDCLENLPTKAYEFMAMGIPVILTDTRYNKKIIDQYQFGICVDPLDLYQFENALRTLLDSPEEATRLGYNGRKLIAEHFNWEREKNNLLGIYDQIISKR